jgi:Lysylphosphatidylglycerol synthase TM region
VSAAKPPDVDADLQPPVQRRGSKLKLVGWTVAAIAVTALCLRLILTGELVHTMREVLPRVDPLPLLLVLPLTLVINLVRGARFSLALGTRGPGSTRRMFQICALLVFLNFMLPFKTGEVSFPVLAKRSFDTSYATSIGVLVYSRVMDLLMVLALGGLVLTEVGPPSARTLTLLGALAATATLLLLPLLLTWAHDIAQKLTRSRRVLELMERLFQGCRSVATPRRHAEYLALTLALWGLLATCGVLTMRAMGARSSLLDGVLASTAASITFAFPVSGVAGVGPMQASWAYALTLVGWKWEVAVANAFLYHATMVACSAVWSLAAIVPTRSRAEGAR